MKNMSLILNKCQFLLAHTRTTRNTFPPIRNIVGYSDATEIFKQYKYIKIGNRLVAHSTTIDLKILEIDKMFLILSIPDKNIEHV